MPPIDEGLNISLDNFIKSMILISSRAEGSTSGSQSMILAIEQNNWFILQAQPSEHKPDIVVFSILCL